MKNIYNKIRQELDYQKANELILPTLGQTFSTREFYDRFLAFFDQKKVYLLDNLSFKRLIRWLHIYYLPRMVSVQVSDYWIKGKARFEEKKWVKNHKM